MEKNGDKQQTKVIKQSQLKPRQKQRRLEDPPESDYRILRALYGFMHTWLAFLAQTRVGNYGYRWIDVFLFKIQRSVEWCIPKKGQQPGESAQNDVERPLPWIIFIPTLVYLRVLRTYLSFASIILNGNQYTRENLLESTMNLRHYIRGLKALALRQGAAEAKKERERKDARYFWRAYYYTRDLVLVRKASGGSYCSNNRKQLLSNSSKNETEVQKNNLNKRAYSAAGDESEYGMTEEDLTFQQLLEKYGLAEENSMEDPDFDPKDLASSDSEDEISETEDDFAHGEIQKLKDDMKRAIFTEHLNGNLENYPGLPANGVESKPAEPANSGNEYQHTNGGEDFIEQPNCSPIDKENMPANHDGDKQQLNETQPKPKQDAQPKDKTKKPEVKQNSNIPQPNNKHRPQVKFHTKSAKLANKKNFASQSPSDSNPTNSKKSSPF